jgi:3-oxoacyl-[acyl-carrier protein] reductase
MDLGLKGKRALVTGGSRGIGRAVLEILADEGVDVAFFSRNAGQVDSTVQALKRRGVKVFGEALDAADANVYSTWLERAGATLGGVDIFVHNMSSSGSGATRDWSTTFEIDIMGAVRGIEVLTPLLSASGAGAVVFLSSTAAVETFLSANAFNTFKAGLVTYGKQLSEELGPKGVRVNCVSPGPTAFEGGNWSKIKQGRPELFQATEQKAALRRLGSAEEVARAIVFLSSPAASYITGVNLVVDGGYTKRVQL